MSRFVDRAATDEVTLANGDRVWVRQRLTGEDQALLSRELVKMSLDAASGEVAVEEFTWYNQQVAVCRAYLVRWDFRDDEEQAVPFSPEAVNRLDDYTVAEIAQAVDRLQKTRREAFQKKA